ncbi:hypothetical protein [Nostoc sp. UHCC 0302]
MNCPIYDAWLITTQKSAIGEKVAKLLLAAMQGLKTLPRESFIKIFRLLP